MYLSTSIGESYKEWKNGDIYFISAPTGSGKSTFIIKDLLPHFAQMKKRILYLVNRTVLKQQIENDIIRLSEGNNRSFIHVELYQTIENKILELTKQETLSDYWQGGVDALKQMPLSESRDTLISIVENQKENIYMPSRYLSLQWYSQYDCVVCDEAHYFLMDSTYNTKTDLSYRFVKDFFKNKLRIYMSATIEDIKNYIVEDYKKDIYIRTPYLGIETKFGKIPKLPSIYEVSYNENGKYDYLDICIFKNRSELVNSIFSGKEKWLIFVDNKDYGKQLKKELELKFDGKCDIEGNPYVSFITSDYKNDYEALEQVTELTLQSKQNSKILIATAVLDNGINVHDRDLRNLVIIADTKIEFLQMLGRKRKDTGRVKLFLALRDKNHFEKRYYRNKQKLELADSVFSYIEDQIRMLSSNGLEVERTEVEAIRTQHKFLLSRLIEDKISVEDVKSLFMSWNGVLCLNMLSVRQTENLNEYYTQVIEDFEVNGEDAFIETQLGWLGWDADRICRTISRAKMSEYESNYIAISECFENFVNRTLNEEEAGEFQTLFYKNMKRLFEIQSEKLIEKDEKLYNRYYQVFVKKGTKVSAKCMVYLREMFGFPYIMNVKDGLYTLSKVEELETKENKEIQNS